MRSTHRIQNRQTDLTVGKGHIDGMETEQPRQANRLTFSLVVLPSFSIQ